MGGEFRRKGVNVLLGPVVGPVGRVVEGGRNWEGFSVDRSSHPPFHPPLKTGKTNEKCQPTSAAN